MTGNKKGKKRHCKKCGRPLKGHPLPTGDKCTLAKKPPPVVPDRPGDPPADEPPGPGPENPGGDNPREGDDELGGGLPPQLPEPLIPGLPAPPQPEQPPPLPEPNGEPIGDVPPPPQPDGGGQPQQPIGVPAQPNGIPQPNGVPEQPNGVVPQHPIGPQQPDGGVPNGPQQPNGGVPMQPGQPNGVPNGGGRPGLVPNPGTELQERPQYPAGPMGASMLHPGGFYGGQYPGMSGQYMFPYHPSNFYPYGAHIGHPYSVFPGQSGHTCRRPS